MLAGPQVDLLLDKIAGRIDVTMEIWHDLQHFVKVEHPHGYVMCQGRVLSALRGNLVRAALLPGLVMVGAHVGPDASQLVVEGRLWSTFG
jgi:hypothetical protein